MKQLRLQKPSWINQENTPAQYVTKKMHWRHTESIEHNVMILRQYTYVSYIYMYTYTYITI